MNVWRIPSLNIKYRQLEMDQETVLLKIMFYKLALLQTIHDTVSQFAPDVEKVREPGNQVPRKFFY